MSGRTLRIGVVGTGYIAQQVHIPGFQLCSDVEVVAVCDVEAERAREVAARFGISGIYESYLDMLAQEDLDAVSVCTPNVSHHPIVLSAIEAGVDVLCEKPLAMSYAEAREMYEKAEQAGLVHMVCFTFRFSPAACFAKHIIDRGLLGEIWHYRALYLAGWLNLDVPYGWRMSKTQAGSGALADLGSHLIDLSRYFVGEAVGEYREVCGRARTFIPQRRLGAGPEMGIVDVDDAASFSSDFANGALGTFEVSRCAPGRGIGKDDYMCIEISGSKGSLIYEKTRPTQLQLCLGEVFTEFNAFVTLKVPEEFLLPFDFFNWEQMRVFVDLLKGGQRDAPTFYDGMKCQEVLEAVAQSIESRRYVRLPL